MPKKLMEPKPPRRSAGREKLDRLPPSLRSRLGRNDVDLVRNLPRALTEYTWSLEDYIGPHHLPVYIDHTLPGRHPERLFHDHRTSEIAIVVRGSAVRHLTERSGENGKTESAMAELHQGDVIVVHPGLVHAYDNTDDFEVLNIVYDPNRLLLPLLDGRDLPFIRLCFPGSRALPLPAMTEAAMNLPLRKLAEVCKKARLLGDDLRDNVRGGLFLAFIRFLDIVAFLADNDSTVLPPEDSQKLFLIDESVRFMMRHYAEPVSLDQLAHAAKMSRRNFCRHFREMAGCSPMTQLLNIRLNHAADLLRNTDTGISEIAVSCGFCDGNYFCSRFKAHFAMTPRAFRLTANRRKPPLRRLDEPAAP